MILDLIFNKIIRKIRIYKTDIKSTGVYWSIIHRLYKIPKGRLILTPIVNALKPNFLIIQGNKFYIDKSDTTISQELILSGKWEDYETELFKKYVKKDDIVLDIGAHIGYYTLIAARKVGIKGLVYAFEPDPKNFEILKRNVKENNFKNVILIKNGISDKSGNLKLYINNENTGDNRIYYSHNKWKSINIHVVTIDDFFKNKSKKVDFIKMDIQGAEASAFKGALGIVKKNRNIKILSEFWPYGLELNGSSAKEYGSLLIKNKLKIFDIDENKRTIKLINLNELILPINAGDKDYKNLLCLKEV